MPTGLAGGAKMEFKTIRTKRDADAISQYMISFHRTTLRVNRTRFQFKRNKNNTFTLITEDSGFGESYTASTTPELVYVRGELTERLFAIRKEVNKAIKKGKLKIVTTEKEE